MSRIRTLLYDDGARFGLACDLISVGLALAAVAAIKAAGLAGAAV